MNLRSDVTSPPSVEKFKVLYSHCAPIFSIRPFSQKLIELPVSKIARAIQNFSNFLFLHIAMRRVGKLGFSGKTLLVMVLSEDKFLGTT